MNLKILLASLLSTALWVAADPVPVRAETPAEQEARMSWFRDAKFGMFIHWGLYSQLAGEWRDKTVTGGAEWIQKYLEIPSSQYSTLVKTWNPTNYDAREWVRLMKAAGVKYICITTKHHDGFCLWPTKMNDDWNVSLTPGGKDLLKPLADACRAEGLQFCIYHSVLDWHHQDWPGRPAFNDYAKGKPDKAKFKNYLYGQLKELFTGYGPIGMVWFDGTWDRVVWTSDDGKALEDYTRSLQPGVIINNRSGWMPPQRKLDFKVDNAYGYIFAGDYISPEGEVPPTGLPGIDWETCQTMQLPNNWGYNRLVGFRPFSDLLHQLVDVTSKGGNMLLNIGPHADGTILPQAQRCLEKFGDWMAVNAESIHGTRASPFPQLPFNGRCTQKPGVLYLHVFARPADGWLKVPVSNRVRRVRLLAGSPGSNLEVKSSVQGLEIALPQQLPDLVDTVVLVEIEGPPTLVTETPAGSCVQSSPEEMAKAAGVTLPPSPWHVANVWWELEKPVEHFESLEVDVTIDRDVPDTYNLYVSPCGVAKINGLQFYGGLQSNINGWANRTNQTRVHPGKGAIFSRWSSDLKTKIGLEHVRKAESDCLVESAGYEGEFASVRRPFKWTKGTYTYQIVKGATEVADGKTNTWFTCRVKDSAGEVHEIGSLRFEGGDFTFWERHSAFVEVYSTAKIPNSGIPKVNVTFGWPRLNGHPPALKRAHAYYPSKTGPASPDCAWIKADGESVRVEVGPIFKRDEAMRRHDVTLQLPVKTTQP